jgi:hypothetical protein
VVSDSVDALTLARRTYIKEPAKSDRAWVWASALVWVAVAVAASTDEERTRWRKTIERGGPGYVPGIERASRTVIELSPGVMR